MDELDRETQEEMGIKATVLALREQVMRYFKGDSITRFVSTTNVRANRTGRPLTEFQYQRREWEDRRETEILLGDIKVMTLTAVPERIVVHTAALQRSPQLRKINELVDQFINSYLPSIERNDDAND